MIFVNGEIRSPEAESVSYAQMVFLAWGDIGDLSGFTVTYRRGPKEQPEGSLLEGQTVKLVDGMIFNARRTTNT